MLTAIEKNSRTQQKYQEKFGETTTRWSGFA